MKKNNFLQSELRCRAYSLKGTLEATLYCSFDVLVLVESPFTWFSLLLGKRTFFPFKAQHLYHGHWLPNILAEKPLQTTMKASTFGSDSTTDIYEWRLWTQKSTPTANRNTFFKMADKISTGQAS